LFKKFVPDRLGASNPATGRTLQLRARAVFGAHCLYSDDKFFGILDFDRF
jgi:hypothetical protein